MQLPNENAFPFSLLVKTIRLILCFFTIIPTGFSAVNFDDLVLVASQQADPEAKMKALNKVYAYYAETKPDSAIIIADEMLLLSTKTNKKDEARAHYKKGYAYQNLGKQLEAEKELNIALSLSIKNNDKNIEALSLHYIGRIYSWKTMNKEAIKYLRQAQKIFSDLKDAKYVAISNNQIAFQFQSLGNYDSAFFFFNKNIENRDKVKYTYTILLSYQCIAGLYSQFHNNKKAYRYLLEGIEYAEKTNSTYSLAELYLATGKLLLENHIYEDVTLNYLLGAKKIFKQLNSDNTVCQSELVIGDFLFAKGDNVLALQHYRAVANNMKESGNYILSDAYHKIAMVYKNYKQYDTASIYFQKSIDEMCKICPEISIHNTLIESADVCLKTGQYKLALQLLYRAKNIAIQAQAGLEITLSDEALANYYKTINNTDSALFYYSSALNRANNIGLNGNILDIANSLSEIYYSRCDFKKAADFLSLAKKTNDSITLNNKSDEQAKLEIRLEILKNEEERQREIMASQNEIKRQKFIRNYTLAGSAVIAVIAFFLFKAYRRKRKDNQLLAEQKEEIQQMAQYVHETDRNKLLFFTNISHEIRTPLTLIKSPLEQLVKATEENGDINKQLKLALNNTEKLQHIVNQILDLRKLDENQLVIRPSTFDIVSSLKELATSFEAFCHQTKCKLIFHSNTTDALIYFDQSKLSYIVGNVMSNAFKYNREEGEVTLKIEITRQVIYISVQDTGIGIAEEDLKKLGTRYYQADTSVFFSEGSGIGLAYVKELVDLMNGKLKIVSKINEGTIVDISLPCSQIEIQNHEPFSFDIKPNVNIFEKVNEIIADDEGYAHSNCILVVEDNYDLRIFIKDLFSHTYRVICAKDGQEGKDLAIKHNPGLIISDIMMPGIQGTELCKILKNDIRTSHIPIVLITAKDNRESQVDGYQCGADDYIVKPFDTELLLQKVKNILATRDNVRKHFSFGDENNKDSTVYNDLDRELLKKCSEIIQSNLDNSSFTVELLSEEVGMSRRTLHRKFLALTGQSPSDLIKHIRMSHAAILLREGKLRVNEVAAMVGYEDSKRFSSAFKQFHGVTPSDFI